MRSLTRWLLLLLTAFVPLAGQAAPSVIADGTPIVVMLPKAMTSGGPKVGSTVPLIVRDTIYDADGQTLVQSGAEAQATITASREAKRLLRPGSLDFVVDYVTAVDGTKVIVRGMHRKAGKKVGIAARIGISLLFRPLMLRKGKDVSYPAGMQFAVYADGDQKVAGVSTPEAPRPVVVSSLMALCADADTVLYTFALTNPNHQHGLMKAAVIATVQNAEGDPIGSNTGPNPGDPQQLVAALGPGQTRTYIKQVNFGGGYAKTDVYVAQPWEIWDEERNPERELRMLYSEWKDERTVTGMVRNEQTTPLRSIEVLVTVRKEGAVSAFGVTRFESLAANANQRFEVRLTGPTTPGTAYDVSAYGRVPPPAK
ncbi:hypothetical protein LLH03_18590 [bacterium]|nr:hypothetical protein [bacterium]